MEIDGGRIDILAGIHAVSGYSAHADQARLVRLVTGTRHWPKEMRLIHGDDACAALGQAIESATAGQVKVLNGGEALSDFSPS